MLKPFLFNKKKCFPSRFTVVKRLKGSTGILWWCVTTGLLIRETANTRWRTKAKTSQKLKRRQQRRIFFLNRRNKIVSLWKHVNWQKGRNGAAVIPLSASRLRCVRVKGNKMREMWEGGGPEEDHTWWRHASGAWWSVCSVLTQARRSQSARV